LLKEVLLVEDSPGDVRLTKEAFCVVNQAAHLHVANDGEEAMAFLNQEGACVNAPFPDLILNMPRMDDRETLLRIKGDQRLKIIPIVILTTSDAEEDVLKTYQLQANCYVSKPIQFDQFEAVVKSINDFWLEFVKLPTRR
jgi:chemotaxis family two-component system response regulator Rcp1